MKTDVSPYNPAISDAQENLKLRIIKKPTQDGLVTRTQKMTHFTFFQGLKIQTPPEKS